MNLYLLLGVGNGTARCSDKEGRMQLGCGAQLGGLALKGSNLPSFSLRELEWLGELGRGGARRGA